MAGIDAFGTTLGIDDGGAGFDLVGEITELDVLDVEVEDLDVTTHDSPDQWREYLGGLKDGGELSFTLNFDPALHASLLDEVGAPHTFQIILPADADDAEVDFAGHINGMSAAAPHDDKLEAEMTIKVSGAPTITIPA
jgi:predicted secreted protein